jgi:hypothetical protein
MAKKVLKKLSTGKVTTFKIKNRRGYAAIFANNLTEDGISTRKLGRYAHTVPSI